jgi:hypothetical protein
VLDARCSLLAARPGNDRTRKQIIAVTVGELLSCRCQWRRAWSAGHRPPEPQRNASHAHYLYGNPLFPSSSLTAPQAHPRTTRTSPHRLLSRLPPAMPSSPTPGAPTTQEELKELLKDDTKVKVAGESQRDGATSDPICTGDT